jgi:DNA repair exonuclease SbcCD ATPase subunit
VDKKEEVTIKSNSPSKRRTGSVTGIPMLKPTSGLSERPTSGNTVKLPPSTPRSPTKAGSSSSPPKKLKMQSPQKLRERLQNQQRDIESASKDLQSELSAIGHELSARPTPRLTAQSSAPPVLSDTPSSRSLEARVASLEKTLKATMDTLTSRTSTIASDVSSSLQVSEARAKHLDQLYRDMNAENEALYARFNEELEKVEKGVRKGKGGEEVDRRLKASEEESARLRKENARLKREVAGLKAQIRE